MIDDNIKKILKELEQKKVEAKKIFKDYEDEVAYGRWQAFQEVQDIIKKYLKEV